MNFSLKMLIYRGISPYNFVPIICLPECWGIPDAKEVEDPLVFLLVGGHAHEHQLTSVVSGKEK